MFRVAECREVLNKIVELAENSKTIKPNYEKFREYLQNELEEHKNQPNYNKFDWQD